MFGKLKNETPKIISIDEFIALRNKAYHLNLLIETLIKKKGISKSQSKCNKFKEYYISLLRDKYKKECDNYVIRSINHEIYLQRVSKWTLSPFDAKRC